MKTLFIAAILLLSCGEGREETEYRYPDDYKPPADDAGNDGADSFRVAFDSIQRVCVSCHGGSQNPPLRSEQEVKAVFNRVCVRTGNGTMPPGGNISQSDKDAILGECK